MSDTQEPSPSETIHTPEAVASGSAGGGGGALRTVTRVNRKWWIKIVVFAVLLLGLGVAGYIDAAIAYPTRGHQVAQNLEAAYLREVDRMGSGDLGGAASIVDPKAVFAELSKRKNSTPAMNNVELARFQWLEALAAVSKLDAANTVYPREAYYAPEGITAHIAGPRERIAEIDAYEKAKFSKGLPKPLSQLDIPVQWLITAVGLIGGVWMLVLIARVAAAKYSWDAAEQRLTFPDGASIVPADIEEFDKRKWDKFLITLQVRDGHPQLSGKRVKLDLLRHDPLESWVLEMEKTAFPDAENE